MKRNSRYFKIVSITQVISLLLFCFVGCDDSGTVVETSVVNEEVIDETNRDELVIGRSSEDFERMNYSEVMHYLDNVGFTDISTVNHQINNNGIWNRFRRRSCF